MSDKSELKVFLDEGARIDNRRTEEKNDKNEEDAKS